MTIPSAGDVYDALPRNRWFFLPEEITALYPELRVYEHNSVVSRTLGRLRKELSWGNVCRTGEPGHYNFMIMEGAR